MDDIIQEFLTETSESLASLDMELVKFERDPNDAASLASIFRMLHTIKGTCGFLGLSRLEKVAHAGENVLGKFRDGVLAVTPHAVTLILGCIDRIRQLLAELESTGSEPEGDDSAMITELNAFAEGKSVAPAAAAPIAETTDSTEGGDGAWTPVLDENGFPVAAELLEEFAAAMAVAEGSSISSAEPVVEVVPAPQAAVVPLPVRPVPVPAPAAKEAPKETKESALASASIRVNVDVLETLMTQVSELVLTRNQLLQMVRGRDDSEFNVPLQRLSRITSDLQDGVMKTRMQPIGNAWAKLPRIVRDLALETGKKIELVMLGAETDLDRQVLELIKDPLTHMVRNSADHGLETPDGRRAAGKDETGRITLKAYHEGGHIIILIADDGRGLDVGRIRAKALANGLATESELEAMSERQILQFIFRAGFSTAEKVTSVSGRGVGMDVVRTNIEKIGGTVELASVAGKGTSFTIKIPLTLAIVSALVVESGKERFAIPQINVLELVRASGNSEARIESINRSPVLRLRDRLLPLVSLRSLLHLPSLEAGQEGELFIVVSQVGTYNFGIIVDRVFDTEEIVVKPTSPILRSIPFYSGNTILGDGSVIMILDPNGIAEAAGQVRMGSDDAAGTRAARAASDEAERASFLVFRAGDSELKAVPLGLVARLEEIDVAKIERVDGRKVVQYRDQLMPLVPFNPMHDWKYEGKEAILVFSEGQRSMGLVVGEIVDVVSDQLNLELSSGSGGSVGSAVIGGRAMDIVDIAPYLTMAYSDWFSADPVQSEAEAPRRLLLLIDDSAFFRHLLTPRLAAKGWHVAGAASVAEALKLADAGEPFDVVVASLDLPGLEGSDMVGRFKALDPATPMVALLRPSDRSAYDRANNAGFDHLVARNDWEGLFGIITEAGRERHAADPGLADLRHASGA